MSDGSNLLPGNYYHGSMSSLTDLIGSGTVLVAAGGSLLGVGVAEVAGSHHSLWSNSWFDTGAALLALGLALVLGAIINAWSKPFRRPPGRPPSRGTSAGKRPAQGTAAPRGTATPRVTGGRIGSNKRATPPPARPKPPLEEPMRPIRVPEPALPPVPKSPLYLTLVDENWRLFYNAVWVFGLAIRVTNLTDKPASLSQYWITPHHFSLLTEPLPDVISRSIKDSKEKLKQDHRSELFAGEITIPPLGSVIRWIIDTAQLPTPKGGRPGCSFGMKDTLDNEYSLEILARPAEKYRS